MIFVEKYETKFQFPEMEVMDEFSSISTQGDRSTLDPEYKPETEEGGDSEEEEMDKAEEEDGIETKEESCPEHKKKKRKRKTKVIKDATEKKDEVLSDSGEGDESVTKVKGKGKGKGKNKKTKTAPESEEEQMGKAEEEDGSEAKEESIPEHKKGKHKRKTKVKTEEVTSDSCESEEDKSVYVETELTEKEKEVLGELDYDSEDVEDYIQGTENKNTRGQTEQVIAKYNRVMSAVAKKDGKEFLPLHRTPPQVTSRIKDYFCFLKSLPKC